MVPKSLEFPSQIQVFYVLCVPPEAELPFHWLMSRGRWHILPPLILAFMKSHLNIHNHELTDYY